MKNVIVLFAVLLSFGFHALAQKPTSWRGEGSTGIYEAPKLLAEWPEGGPHVLWSFNELGQGYSSPAFANGKIYLTGMIDSTGYVFVLDMNGKELKRFTYGQEFSKSFPGARTTPTIVGNLLYMVTGHGRLVCLDANTGDEKWAKELFKDFDGVNITWGITENLVVDGDRIFAAPGGKNHNVVALNRLTGETIWTCAADGELSAYCSPLLISHGGRKILVTMMASHILGIDAANGKLLWNYEQPNQWSVHANTPIYDGNSLFCFSGYGRGGVKLNLNADGSAVTKAWFSETFDGRMGGAILVNGYLYGSGDKNRTWQCIDYKTGEQKYSSSELTKGVVIAAGNKMIIYSERGELALAEINPEAFTVISKTMVTLGAAQHWAHPVVNNGILYVRHGDALIAYQISK